MSVATFIRPPHMPLPFLLWGLLDSHFVADLQGFGCTEREWGQIIALVLVLFAGWSLDEENVLHPIWFKP